MRCGLVAVHVDWRRVVERIQHSYSKVVPLNLRELLRHIHRARHRALDTMKPGRREDSCDCMRTEACLRACLGSLTHVHSSEELLQVVLVHVGLAELQLGPRVVVHVVDTHLLHDSEASLRINRRRSQRSNQHLA